jgi:TonB family protein
MPVVAIAVVASLLLHALLLAWPRWPTWDDAAGTFGSAESPLRARLTGGAPPAADAARGTVASAASEAGASADTARRPVVDPDADAAGDRADPTAGLAAPESRRFAPIPPLASSALDGPRASRIAPRAAAGEQAAMPAGRVDPRRGDPGVRGERGRPAPSPTDATGGEASTAAKESGVASVATPVPAAAEPGTKPNDPSPRSVAGDRADIASIAQYRIALISVSRRYKPSESALPTERPEGRVDVRLAIAADGSLADARVTRSSGHELLDTLAVDMLRSAKAQAPVPTRLLDRAFEIEVPVVFGGAAAAR